MNELPIMEHWERKNHSSHWCVFCILTLFFYFFLSLQHFVSCTFFNCKSCTLVKQVRALYALENKKYLVWHTKRNESIKMNPLGERERPNDSEETREIRKMKWREMEEDWGGEEKEREEKGGKEEQSALLYVNWLSHWWLGRVMMTSSNTWTWSQHFYMCARTHTHSIHITTRLHICTSPYTFKSMQVTHNTHTHMHRKTHSSTPSRDREQCESVMMHHFL